MRDRYFRALIFCGARSSSVLILAAAAMAGLGEVRFDGSARAFKRGRRSMPGRLPLRLLVASRTLLKAWGMPRKFHSVNGAAGGGKANAGMPLAASAASVNVAQTKRARFIETSLSNCC